MTDVYDRHGYADEDKRIMAAVARHVIGLVEGTADEQRGQPAVTTASGCSATRGEGSCEGDLRCVLPCRPRGTGKQGDWVPLRSSA